jgi:hypothetical protein
VLRPPTFDSPGTIGLFNHTEHTLISSDSFGTILPEPAEFLDITDPTFHEGFDGFNRAIAPWTGATDLPRFNDVLRRVERLAPSTVLSSHAPVIGRHIGALFNAMCDIPLLPAWLPGSTLGNPAQSRRIQRILPRACPANPRPISKKDYL